MSFKRITEASSLYRHLEKMPVKDIVAHINAEDEKVAEAVAKALPQIERLVSAVAACMVAGGRLFYIGAGTSGRLGILDASECPPTFGVAKGLVCGIIAGGDAAMVNAIEKAEDNTEQGWKDLQEHAVKTGDIVVGIASSGTTPYVISALKKCKENNIATGSISCNPQSPVSAVADHAVEVITGPEFITGSTRMKSGTATKMILNMISTAAMIRLGRVEDNKMVNMQLTNNKVIGRGVQMLMQQTGIKDQDEARTLLLRYKTVKKAVETYLHKRKRVQ